MLSKKARNTDKNCRRWILATIKNGSDKAGTKPIKPWPRGNLGNWNRHLVALLSCATTVNVPSTKHLCFECWSNTPEAEGRFNQRCFRAEHRVSYGWRVLQQVPTRTKEDEGYLRELQAI